jgi:uncharacterized membrane protein
MTREAYIARLRAGLRGLPPAAVSDIVSDYDAHFTEALAAGRSEAAVADALGDPERLARELAAEARVKTWEQQRNPSAATQAIFAVLGLGAIDLLVLFVPLLWVIGIVMGLFCLAIGLFAAGVVSLIAGPMAHVPGGPVAAIFGGLGLMAGGVSLGALMSLASIGLVNALVWYGRLHYRLLKPAIEPVV